MQFILDILKYSDNRLNKVQGYGVPHVYLILTPSLLPTTPHSFTSYPHTLTPSTTSFHLHSFPSHPHTLISLVAVTGCNLRWWHFPSAIGTKFLAPVVVPSVATCAGCLFPSTHWRTYCICSRATCTVLWWSVVVV